MGFSFQCRLYSLSEVIFSFEPLLFYLQAKTIRYLYTELEFLDETQIKVLLVFLLAIHSHLYSFALRFIFLQTHATSYSF
jgi:hypothetical protein